MVSDHTDSVAPDDRRYSSRQRQLPPEAAGLELTSDAFDRAAGDENGHVIDLDGSADLQAQSDVNVEWRTAQAALDNAGRHSVRRRSAANRDPSPTAANASVSHAASSSASQVQADAETSHPLQRHQTLEPVDLIVASADGSVHQVRKHVGVVDLDDVMSDNVAAEGVVLADSSRTPVAVELAERQPGLLAASRDNQHTAVPATLPEQAAGTNERLQTGTATPAAGTPSKALVVTSIRTAVPAAPSPKFVASWLLWTMMFVFMFLLLFIAVLLPSALGFVYVFECYAFVLALHLHHRAMLTGKPKKISNSKCLEGLLAVHLAVAVCHIIVIYLFQVSGWSHEKLLESWQF